MSLKEKVELWQAGVEKADAGKFEDAVDSFTEIPEPSARIYFNISSAFLRLGNLEDAERNLDLCVKRDPHLALGYFQRGCLYLQKQRYVDALQDFETALTNLRGNLFIDYKQLGLQYKLYSCEILYNRAYGELQLGRKPQCLDSLQKGQELASGASENRHRIISNALENVRVGKAFMPYRLPKSCMWFWPPRIMTDVLKPVNFLGQARVLSSIVDQDEFVGFVGTQAQRGRSPSPSPQRKKSPPSDQPRRAPKPNIPPPSPATMNIQSRGPSLEINGGQARPLILPKRESSTKIITTPPSPVTPDFPPKPQVRPPKPKTPPPPVGGRKSPVQVMKSRDQPPNRKSPLREVKSSGPDLKSLRASPVRSPPPSSSEPTMTVKVHYATTRAVRALVSTSFNQLAQIICHKFGRPDGSLTLWYKASSGELQQITSDLILKQAVVNLEDGFRLTMWAYDKNESKPTVLKEVIAVADYSPQYEDELAFSAGDRIQVTLEINEDWYEGQCNGGTGIFPRSYIRDT